MPIVQMDDIDLTEYRLADRLGGGRAKQGKLARIGSERPPRRIVAVDLTRTANNRSKGCRAPAKLASRLVILLAPGRAVKLP
jgi:hypothetical protein